MHDDSFRVISLVADPAGLTASVLSGNNHRPEVLRLRRSPIGSDGFVHRRSCFRFRGGWGAGPLTEFRWPRNCIGGRVDQLPESQHGQFDNGRCALTDSSYVIAANDCLPRNRFGVARNAAARTRSAYAVESHDERSCSIDEQGGTRSLPERPGTSARAAAKRTIRDQNALPRRMCSACCRSKLELGLSLPLLALGRVVAASQINPPEI